VGGEKRSRFTANKQKKTPRLIHISPLIPLFSAPFKQANDFDNSEKYKKS